MGITISQDAQLLHPSFHHFQSENNHPRSLVRQRSFGFLHGILAVVIVLGALFPFGCTSRKRIIPAYSFSQLFSLQSTVALETSDSTFVASTLASIAFVGNRIIVDDLSGCKVLLFDRHGKFISRVGRQGRGPGEYLQPTHICGVDSVIMVYDSYLGMASAFEYSGDYKSTIQTTGWRIAQWGSAEGKIIAVGNDWEHNNEVSVRSIDRDSISEIAVITNQLDFPGLYPFLGNINSIGIDEDSNIYFVEPLSIRITKLSMNGNIIASEPIELAEFKKPEKDYEGGMEPPKPDEMRRMLYHTSPVLSVAYLNGYLYLIWFDANSSPPEPFMEIFDRNLNQVASRVRLPNEVAPQVYAHEGYLYFQRKAELDANGEAQNDVLMKFFPKFPELAKTR